MPRTGAPGTLRVIDDETVYLRMPETYMQPETMLMVLRNLLKSAHEREQKGESLARHPLPAPSWPAQSEPEHPTS